MALSFVQDKTPVDLLKMPLESMRQNLRARFDSIEMDNSAVTSQMKVFLRVRPFKKQEIEKEEDQVRRMFLNALQNLNYVKLNIALI